MDLTHVGVFDLADRRMAWIDQRQLLLARNIANADTPGFAARDLTPFAATLSQLRPAGPVRTNPRHLAGTVDAAVAGRSVRSQERAVDGNAVSMEAELTKVAETETSQELVTNLYKKYLGLFRLALGRS